MRQRIKLHTSEKVYNTGASEMEASALAYKRFKMSNEEKPVQYCAIFFGVKHYVSKAEAMELQSKGYKITIE